MKLLILLTGMATLAVAQPDPAFEAYRAWESAHRDMDRKTRAQALFEVSGEWVTKWPDSRVAWQQRRDALLPLQSRSAELWKQVGDNLIRLSPPHTVAGSTAYDWVAIGVNLNDAEALLHFEINWSDAQPKPVHDAPTLADLVDEANFASRPFPLLCSLEMAEIQLKQFDQAHATIARIHGWLEGDFKRYFDQDPLETFPDYTAKYFLFSADLARAEGEKTDALAFYQRLLTNPYYLREYAHPARLYDAHALWQEMGGTEEGWAAFSEVPPLAEGVPSGYKGVAFLPWVAVDYKLPDMNLSSLDSRPWTNRDFEGKATIVYLWASSWPPCWSYLPSIQAIYDGTKSRAGMQLVTISVDEDTQKLAAFMKQKGYTFPVLASKPYVQKVLPQFMLGQVWLVDRNGAVRLQRSQNMFNGIEKAFEEEVMYKARQLMN
ncbi:MAG: TlpA disulfide reductase family protein [Bryobacteraceae bacterium]